MSETAEAAVRGAMQAGEYTDQEGRRWVQDTKRSYTGRFWVYRNDTGEPRARTHAYMVRTIQEENP